MANPPTGSPVSPASDGEILDVVINKTEAVIFNNWRIIGVLLYRTMVHGLITLGYGYP
jgi:hypothetical protein